MNDKILLLIWNISVAKTWTFMLRIETEPSLSLKIPNDVIIWLYNISRARLYEKTGAFLFHLAISENTSLTEKLTEWQKNFPIHK